jgi:hypothetical protein
MDSESEIATPTYLGYLGSTQIGLVLFCVMLSKVAKASTVVTVALSVADTFAFNLCNKICQCKYGIIKLFHSLLWVLRKNKLECLFLTNS